MFLYKEMPAPLWQACWKEMFAVKGMTAKLLKSKLFWRWPANALYDNVYRGESIIVGADTYHGTMNIEGRVFLSFSGNYYPEKSQRGEAILFPDVD